MTGAEPPAPRKQLRPTDVKRLNRSWRRSTEGRLAVLLNSVAQPYNVGMIVLSAAAFGAEHIWLCGNSAPLDHPSAGKTALGTQRLLSWDRKPDPVVAATAASQAGLRVVAIELAAGADPLHEAPLDGRRVPGPGQRGPRLLARAAGGGRQRGLHPADRPGRVTQRSRSGGHRPGRGPPPRVVGLTTGSDQAKLRTRWES